MREIETALKDELDESQDDEWMGFLERFECRTVPTKEKRKTVILELAHKEMVQIAQYVIDSWQKPVKDRLTGLLQKNRLRSSTRVASQRLKKY